MAFKNSAALCSRFSPPSSPSRRASSTTAQVTAGVGGVKYRSRLLTVLDAGIDANMSPNYGRDVSESKETLRKTETSKENDRATITKPGSAGAAASSSEPLTNPMQPLMQRSAQQSWVPYTRSVARKLDSLPLPTVAPSHETVDPEAPSSTKSEARRRTSSSSVTSEAAASKAPEEKLPAYSYKDYKPAPTIVYTNQEEEANELVTKLKGPIGFDMEWRVFFRRGASTTTRRTALIQLSSQNTILLVHELIEDCSVPKVGVNIRNDGLKLYKDYQVAARNLIELGAFAKQADPSFSAPHKRNIVSLVTMVGMYERREVHKGDVRTGNWELLPLAEDQKIYAANDAHSALMVYLTLCKIKEEKESVLDPKAFTSSIAVESYPEPTTAATGELAEPLAKANSTSSATSESAITESAASTPTTVSANETATSPATSTARNSTDSAAAPISASLPPDTTRSPVPASRQANIDRLAAEIEADRTRRAPQLQHRRAYTLWHHDRMALADICAELRSRENPLKVGTVISYVVRALQEDGSLPYSPEDLKALARSEADSWRRHGWWILEQERRQWRGSGQRG
ncbi:uncharacterized protein PHACADRAFT_172418 [Phanerochaete carnosa HHB-10118-sp]|uniref:3'-5' exonuclease domain-containing protein n=1 Tax=Phanerochaete carnosa (strain HHB-10118-sp) TaxID=650164 RepID=K5WCL0_PHACS|nr:uncharacterized protein PHACADRAFT_172418 [Phanerochaete carnosa HHB-10118-sp]EKM56744.1 hypothetical protein PHACADRAFT_172418 [Phanerochaete carnosa HHB-10118-sp]